MKTKILSLSITKHYTDVVAYELVDTVFDVIKPSDKTKQEVLSLLRNPPYTASVYRYDEKTRSVAMAMIEALEDSYVVYYDNEYHWIGNMVPKNEK